MEWLHALSSAITTWWQGPIGDKTYLLGFQVFWWKRLIVLGQLASGSVILLDLMDVNRKKWLHLKLRELNAKAATVPVPPLISVLKLLKNYFIVCGGIASIMTGIGLLLRVDIPAVGVWFVFFLGCMMIGVPIVQIVFLYSFARTSLHIVRRAVPWVLAFLFDHEHVDRNFIWISFGTLVVVTLFQFCLS